jgi:hypothetical protein
MDRRIARVVDSTASWRVDVPFSKTLIADFDLGWQVWCFRGGALDLSMAWVGTR